MAVGTLPVQSDPTLLADIRRYGKFDPTGCYQCGSCTLSCDLVGGFCNLSPQKYPLALLGLRQPLWRAWSRGSAMTAATVLGLPAAIGAPDLHAHAAALSYRAVRVDGNRLQASPVQGVVSRFLNLRGVRCPAFDHWLPLVVRRDGGQGFCHHSVRIGSHVPAHDLLHPHSDPGSPFAFVFACLPHLAAYHGGGRQAHPAFLHTCSGLGLRLPVREPVADAKMPGKRPVAGALDDRQAWS